MATSIAVPKTGAGQVLVTASMNAQASDLETCNPCFAHLRVSEPGANPVLQSPTIVGRLYPALADGSEATDAVPISQTWMFPATAGKTHTYSLDVGMFPGTAGVETRNPTITAVWIPFQGNGGGGLPPATKAKSPEAGAGAVDESGGTSAGG